MSNRTCTDVLRSTWRRIASLRAAALGQAGRVARTDLESWQAIEVTRDGIPARLTAHGRELLGALQGGRS
ncbi:MAG: hypothetical protein ACTHU0_18395 [Kofleriaceae bacterium]